MAPPRAMRDRKRYCYASIEDCGVRLGDLRIHRAGRMLPFNQGRRGGPDPSSPREARMAGYLRLQEPRMRDEHEARPFCAGTSPVGDRSPHAAPVAACGRRSVRWAGRRGPQARSGSPSARMAVSSTVTTQVFVLQASEAFVPGQVTGLNGWVTYMIDVLGGRSRGLRGQGRSAPRARAAWVSSANGGPSDQPAGPRGRALATRSVVGWASRRLDAPGLAEALTGARVRGSAVGRWLAAGGERGAAASWAGAPPPSGDDAVAARPMVGKPVALIHPSPSTFCRGAP
jgi:hypothetical protein